MATGRRIAPPSPLMQAVRQIEAKQAREARKKKPEPEAPPPPATKRGGAKK